ncbi:MAG: translation elongation factor Ts [Anaeroplasmataceae bacterium]|nr:translation elongation factor Ts [Anaeroplasmataceae bacterium]MDE5867792.1 translation elongation factor Ts [Anaeroplasmataceae bacterium]
MANITASMVKELREKTSAGMLDCKKALAATDGDMEAAVTWLREKGIAKAVKKEGAIAAEGLCSYSIRGNKCVVYELNSQTDFVAQNEKFLNLLDKIGQILVESNATNTEEALNIDVDGKTLGTMILEASGVIGEKITLRRVSVINKNNNEVFGAYKHMKGRIITVATLTGNDDEVAKNIAMHVAALNPRYVSKDDVPADVIEKEREIILAAALNENAQSAKPKPENIVAERIVPGRLEKNLKEICLLSQSYVKNPDQTVEAYVQGAKTSVLSFVRLEVGEGIEKQANDFAAEVAAQSAAFN